MSVRRAMQRVIRPSATRSVAALWAKSLLNAVLFFAIFMVALPWAADWLWGAKLPIPVFVRTWVAGALAVAGVATWVACLDAFSRHGRGTPLPADAPRHLVTRGLFRRVRNPIMVGELAVIWAVALWLSSAGVMLYAALITFVAHVSVVAVEEPELRARFGESYDDYCRDVPRWLPRWRAPRAR